MTSSEWLVYFQSNVQTAQDMPWHLGAKLTDEQKKILMPSLQAFQRGEGSEGNNLARNAKDYGIRTGDTDYEKCIALFIKEEQKHAGFLALYLRSLGEPCLTKTWTDQVFRRLRKGVPLEPSLTVLLTAEIMAMTYYPAVSRAVDCPLLKQICVRIEADESKHLQFQSEWIGKLRKEYSRPRQWLWKIGHRILYGGTVLVVWPAYGSAFRAGGHSFGSYWKACWAAFKPCEARMTV